MPKTTIVLADDHHLVRQALRKLLETEPEFDVVGEAADGLQAKAILKALEPDVLVVDLMMPGLNGLEVARHVRRSAMKTRVVILTMHADEAYVLEALRNGAVGYVLKDSPSADLVNAIRAAAAGRQFLSAPLTDLSIEAYVLQAAVRPTDSYEALTEREREVLHLTAEGLTSAEVADRLCISPRTVETHRANLMHKLGLRTQTDLIRYALRRGIIPIDQ
jgi:two-component system, NarL family, response regulator NreC